MDRDRWSVIISAAATGAWNMALDEAILEAVVTHQAPPTLRLYAWQPPCLSLGQAQPYRDVDRTALTAAGWDLVRRPTGGRAILHTDELTYSVSAPQHEPRVAGSILESYRRLSAALLLALQIMHLPARADQQYPLPEGAQQNGAVCFEVPSNYEITVEGKKLIGSAQARRLGGVLQHGSLPLYGDLTRITQVLAYPNEQIRKAASNRLIAHATTVEKILKRPPTWQEAANAFQKAFETALDLELVQSEPLKSELNRADELVSRKYGLDDWNLRL